MSNAKAPLYLPTREQIEREKQQIKAENIQQMINDNRIGAQPDDAAKEESRARKAREYSERKRKALNQ